MFAGNGIKIFTGERFVPMLFVAPGGLYVLSDRDQSSRASRDHRQTVRPSSILTHTHTSHVLSHSLGIPVSRATVTKSGIGESNVRIAESVREDDVYIINTGCGQVNTALMELCIMIHACKIASAKRITAVVPLFPYARQDKKDKSRAPITAKLVANMLQKSGCDHVVVRFPPVDFREGLTHSSDNGLACVANPRLL